MQMTVKVDDTMVRSNLSKLSGKLEKATELGLRDTIVEIANDVIKGSRKITGNNRRSIAYGVGTTKKREGKPARGQTYSPLEPKPPKLTGEVYSTSGYGGILETGTSKMGGIPYFKPALDRNLPNLGRNIKEHL